MRLDQEGFASIELASAFVKVGLSLPCPATAEAVDKLRSLIRSQETAIDGLVYLLREAYMEIDRLEADLLSRPE